MPKHFCVGRICLVAILTLTLSMHFLISTARASYYDPPRIENITWEVVGTNTWLTITARYQGFGTNGDGVDMIQFKVDGRVYEIWFTLNYYDDPQPTYMGSLDVGVVAGTPTVQARAHSPVDGWGDWSSPVAIPEFPTPLMVLFLAALIMLVVSPRLSNRINSEPTSTNKDEQGSRLHRFFSSCREPSPASWLPHT